MFDVGFWELALISVIALVIVGPERLPGVARTAGLWVGKARRMLNEVKSDINRELREHDVADLNTLKSDIQNAGREFKSTTESISESVDATSISQSLKDTVDEAASPVDTKDSPKTNGKSEAARGGNGVNAPPKKTVASKKVSRKKAASKKKTTKKAVAKKTATARAVGKKRVTRKKTARRKAPETKSVDPA